MPAARPLTSFGSAGRIHFVRCSGFSVGIIDFDPVPVRVLEVDLPHPVWSDLGTSFG